MISISGYDDLGEVWRSYYEVDDLEEIAERLYEQLRPLYENLHAYTRRKLYNRYGSAYVNLRGPIPAHLLGENRPLTLSVCLGLKTKSNKL